MNFHSDTASAERDRVASDTRKKSLDEWKTFDEDWFDRYTTATGYPCSEDVLIHDAQETWLEARHSKMALVKLKASEQSIWHAIQLMPFGL